MVVPWTAGAYVPTESAHFDRLRSWVRDLGVGGILPSIGPPLELADLLNRLQRAASVPLLVMTDLEHGPGQRLDAGVLLPWGSELGGGTDFPPAMAIAATGDPSLAYSMGRITAQEGRAAGIRVALAPVADVNNNPDNPVINTRSYGEDPAAVARFAVAQLRGLQEHGMLATAKHFPGHGDVSSDTHLAPYILRLDTARLDSVELVPFRAAIQAGVAAVMSAHIAVPALTGDSTVPATLSRRMLDSLLVGEMGFQGLVITDALDMGALVEVFGPRDAAVRAVEAGADILLQPVDPGAVVDAVVEAVEGGRVTAARIDRSVRRILEAKARVGLGGRGTVPLEEVAGQVGAASHRAVAAEVAARGITLVRDRDGLVPLQPLRFPRVLAISYSDDVDPFAARHLAATLAPALPAFRAARLGPGEPVAVLDSVFAMAESADLTVFVSNVRARSSKGSIAIEEPVAERVRALIAARPTVVVSLGSPYILQQLPDAGTYVLGWGGAPVSQVATARALLGDAPIGGRLPTSIPPLAPLGAGLDRAGPGRWGAGEVEGPGDVALSPVARNALDSLDAAVEAAIAARVTPGAAVAVGRGGRLLRLRGYGRLDYAAGSPPASDSTVYDLASLTKVVGTTTAVMLLVDRGMMSLDRPLSAYLPAWPRGGWRDAVTVRRLLTHTAGLPPFERFWHPSAGGLRGDSAVVAAIARLPASYEPGTRTVYSDLGFILLGAAVAHVAGEPLSAFLDREIWTPLGMGDTGFLPRPAAMAAVRAEGGLPALSDSAWSIPIERIAPTEMDTVFRHTHVHGVVHDENAFTMGGVSGHAGLFSTAGDLARFARFLLRAGRADGVRLIHPETVLRFTSRAGDRGGPGNPGSRALGWDLAPGSGDIAAALSPAAFGHTGFTGTTLWLDPTRDLYVVLLSNRVDPSRDGTGIGALRRAVLTWAARAADGISADP